MSDSEKYPYLWIPEEDISDVPLERSVSEDTPEVQHEEHGLALLRGLLRVSRFFARLHRDGTVSYGESLTFKLILQKHVAISRHRGFLEDLGIKVNAMHDSVHAVVTVSQESFERLNRSVFRYRERGDEHDFRYIASFAPITARDKLAESLRVFLKEHPEEKSLDVGIMMLPRLTKEQKREYTARVTLNIQRHEGRPVGEPYELTDGTRMIRAVIPLSAVLSVLNDPAVYRAEKTSFFRVNEPDGRGILPRELRISPGVDIEALPAVVILDDGVNFPKGLEKVVVKHWPDSDVDRNDRFGEHGTPVAGRAAFADLGGQIEKSPLLLTPRARIIDAKIVDSKIVSGELSADDLIPRIQEAVRTFAPKARIFNFSYNLENPGSGTNMSRLGAELDHLAIEYGIRFTVSAGNHLLFKSSDSLAEIFSSPDTVITEPADAMLGIAVGTAVGVTHPGSVSLKDDIAPYSRRGPGHGGFYKPDLVEYGTTVHKDGTWPLDKYEICLNRMNCSHGLGTSLAAPDAAGDLAQVMASLPGYDIGLAQALLYQGAAMPYGIRDDWIRELGLCVHDFYGLGISSPENSVYRSGDKAVFLHSGVLSQGKLKKLKLHIPQAVAGEGRKGGQKIRVAVACLTQPPLDFSSTEYTLAYISVSLHWLDSKGKSVCSYQPASSTCRKWDTRCRFSKELSGFSPGDWELWLEPHTRGNIDVGAKIPFALAVQVEDLLKGGNLYSGIIKETGWRYVYRPFEHALSQIWQQFSSCAAGQ